MWHAGMLLVEAGNVRVTLQAFSKAVIDIAEMADVSEEDLLMASHRRWSIVFHIVL